MLLTGEAELNSKVIELIALFSDGKEHCFCEKENYKTCPKRIKGNLKCVESIVRITPIERDSSNDIDNSDDLRSIRNLDNELSKVSNNFKKVLKHIDGMRIK